MIGRDLEVLEMKPTSWSAFVVGLVCLVGLTGACGDHHERNAAGALGEGGGGRAGNGELGGAGPGAGGEARGGGAGGRASAGSGSSPASDGGAAGIGNTIAGSSWVGGTSGRQENRAGNDSGTGGSAGNDTGAGGSAGNASSGGSAGNSGTANSGAGGSAGDTGFAGRASAGDAGAGGSAGNVSSGGSATTTGGIDTSLGGDANASASGGGSAGGSSTGLGGGGSSTGGGTGGDSSTVCTIAADYEISEAIPTVGIVTWSANADVTSAHIEFGLEGSANVMEAPVDLAEPGYRTLLLGMKQASNYVFRIVAETSSGTCVSRDYTLATGTLAGAPSITRTGSEGSRGFIVTTTGIGVAGSSGRSISYIFDTDGDVVWLAAAPSQASRARMSWDGKHMWAAALNNMGSTDSGEMRRVSMDGLDIENDVPGLSGAHHDFTVTPDGVAAIVFNSSGCSGIVERSNDGTITTLVADVSTIYTPNGDCHTNYLRYYESDDTFTVSDRNPNLFVKIARDGTLLWQFGGTSPLDASFSVAESWRVNHGHDLGDNGRFVFFNNGDPGTARVLEFQLNGSNMTASRRWTYSPGMSSSTLGDVQRLPEGHYLVTFSSTGIIHEIDSSQRLAQSFRVQGLGYAEFRRNLYGPPVHY